MPDHTKTVFHTKTAFLPSDPTAIISPTSTGTSKSVTAGAAAGIGIGTFLVGALLAAAAVFFLMRSSRSHRNHEKGERGESHRYRSSAREKKSSSKYPTVTVTTENPSTTSIIERALPQPAEDTAIGGELSKIRTLIKNHAQSYYNSMTVASSRMSASSINQAALEAVGRGMPISISNLTSALLDPSKRLLAIRFCVAWTALSRIEPDCPPETTFLPPELAACMASMSSHDINDQTYLAFLSKWRTITAFLLQGKYSNGSFPATDARLRATSDALSPLDALLRSFADPARDQDERHHKLEEILKRTAKIGYLLFEQPGSYHLEWKASDKEWVIWPALLQVIDDSGRRVEKPRVVEDMEVVEVGGWR